MKTPKIITCLCVFLAAPFLLHAADLVTLAQFDFQGTSGSLNTTGVAASTESSALVDVTLLTRASSNALSLSGESNQLKIQANTAGRTGDDDTKLTLARALGGNAYFSFTITANTDVVLSSLTFRSTASVTDHGRGFWVLSSIGGFGTDAAPGPVLAGDYAVTDHAYPGNEFSDGMAYATAPGAGSNTVNAGAAYDAFSAFESSPANSSLASYASIAGTTLHAGESVEFRFYVQLNGTASSPSIYFDNITVTGTAIPEPGSITLAGSILVLIAALVARRRTGRI
ncbi:hypothetical protein OpiT1DRAFT_04709 [Opitutaceae bacterium TAV1]|nr:hypothetical protein OpiT1DRAFT_04709 [Opitutaceae bacterium TAV1]